MPPLRGQICVPSQARTAFAARRFGLFRRSAPQGEICVPPGVSTNREGAARRLLHSADVGSSVALLCMKLGAASSDCVKLLESSTTGSDQFRSRSLAHDPISNLANCHFLRFGEHGMTKAGHLDLRHERLTGIDIARLNFDRHRNRHLARSAAQRGLPIARSTSRARPPNTSAAISSSLIVASSR